MLSHPFFHLARGYNSVVQLNEIMFYVHAWEQKEAKLHKLVRKLHLKFAS